ncbi:MAG: cation acetate symporter [Planctomycetota bacterium]
MNEVSFMAVGVFLVFVLGTVALSFYLGRKAKDSAGYFAAHGQIPWAINGVAFAGDYLSAASFLGICGMIAAYGYDGFLYSIGFLAGWIVALFVIAEPMKRLGKFTFADALDANFDSRGIKAAAGLSTLIVSVFYLIPQMVGAGALITPLLGLPHWSGVVIVGIVVILIVVTAGMVSTTWVQFLKGSLLVIFSAILVVCLLQRGFEESSDSYEEFLTTQKEIDAGLVSDKKGVASDKEVVTVDGWPEDFLALQDDDGLKIYKVDSQKGPNFLMLRRAQATNTSGMINGVDLVEMDPAGHLWDLPNQKETTGPVGPIEFFTTLSDSTVVLNNKQVLIDDSGTSTTVFVPRLTPGNEVLRPGEHPKFAGIRSDRFIDKLNFLSLMLALFCGTASLPHILIRYYTVKDASAARKSTILGIATIGFFYVLTLYLGLGAMTSWALDLTDSNMAAPLLARSISPLLFAIISAIAFTTVLGTVSGLILASSGAIAHDLLGGVAGVKLDEKAQVRVAKTAAVIVGGIAIVLGILFKELNVGYLVGWAFSIAASANLPALTMLLFWKRTTKQGIIASVTIGAISSLTWILLSSDTYSAVYGLDPSTAPTPFSQPGIVTIPLAFIVLVVVSLATKKETPSPAV